MVEGLPIGKRMGGGASCLFNSALFSALATPSALRATVSLRLGHGAGEWGRGDADSHVGLCPLATAALPPSPFRENDR